MHYRTLIKLTIQSLPPSVSPTLKNYIIKFYRINLPVIHSNLNPPQQKELATNFVQMLRKVYAHYQSPSQIQPNSQLSLSYLNHNFIELNPNTLNLTDKEQKLYRFYSRVQFFYLLAVYKIFPKKFVGDKAYYFRNAEELDGMWKIGVYEFEEGKFIDLYGPKSIREPKKRGKK